ncbi:hypothetical protein HZH68_008678 [Vespula germanica]|uniref:Thioredoxin domain-containing protein n=1 Tax=Vespula germanica TaxID=30212 RepID=A0A834K542_VESGE|nr:hypothetical protein HZH68_008678 [Vespula germanica]
MTKLNKTLSISTMIFGIGTGLFLILTLWAIAILIFLISLRIEKKIGLVVVVVIGLLTIILFSIPRASEKPNVNEKKVMNGKRTVVVNFHADWCDPCTVLTPKLIELIEPIETLDLAIINLESNPDLADVFSVKAVPAVFAMSNGLVLEKFIGLQDVGMIEKFVEKLTAQDATNSNIESNSVNLKMDNSVNPKDSDVKS